MVSVVVVLGVGHAGAVPADPFTGASAKFDQPARSTVDLNVGDWGVADQRGANTYTFPVVVPPGRNGMAPDLALRYSSQSALRGGVAVGWSLDVPAVRLDRSLGYTAAPVFAASLRGASGRLVSVPDAKPCGGDACRVEVDHTFTRFFNVHPGTASSSWIALTTDGVTHYFGTELFAGDGVSYWPLTRQVDSFGNTVRYFWDRVVSGRFTGYRLDRIEYTSNTATGLAAHAQVQFTYRAPDLCDGSQMPIGAAPTSANPSVVEGAQRLTAITTSVHNTPALPWRLARRTSLTYELRNSVLHGPIVAPDQLPANRVCTEMPLRYLTKLQTFAFSLQGTATVLPQPGRRSRRRGAPP
jgi:hypothetical protein